MKRLIALAMAVVLVGVLAGCSSGSGSKAAAETLELTAASMAFGAKEVTVQKGKTYKLVFKNNDAQEHDFAIDKIPVKVEKEGHDSGHGASKAALHVHSEAGKAESVEFTPTEAGVYSFYCSIAGHKDAGMVGKLIVK